MQNKWEPVQLAKHCFESDRKIDPHKIEKVKLELKENLKKLILILHQRWIADVQKKLENTQIDDLVDFCITESYLDSPAELPEFDVYNYLNTGQKQSKVYKGYQETIEFIQILEYVQAENPDSALIIPGDEELFSTQKKWGENVINLLFYKLKDQKNKELGVAENQNNNLKHYLILLINADKNNSPSQFKWEQSLNSEGTTMRDFIIDIFEDEDFFSKLDGKENRHDIETVSKILVDFIEDEDFALQKNELDWANLSTGKYIERVDQTVLLGEPSKEIIESMEKYDNWQDYTYNDKKNTATYLLEKIQYDTEYKSEAIKILEEIESYHPEKSGIQNWVGTPGVKTFLYRLSKIFMDVPKDKILTYFKDAVAEPIKK